MTGYAFGQPGYGLTRTLPNTTLDDAKARVTETLAAQGFGVLNEIDLRTTLKNKLDVDVDPYIILGACNPRYAHMALNNEPGIGLLLPCNVVVAQGTDGVVVSAIDPRPMFKLVNNPEVAPLAEEVAQCLQAALDAL